METTIAIVCAVIALLVPPIYLVLLTKGIRSLDDIRRALNRPIGRRN